MKTKNNRCRTVIDLFHFYNFKDPVIDTTGAGDAFNGAFAVALSKDLNIKEALTFANKVAGISTTKQGAAASMPSLEDLKNY